MQALKALGEFKDGVFRRREDVPGKHNMEAYEAIWEHVMQRELIYPKPRYAAPVLMDPDHFAWVAVADGVEEKLCGVFTERRTSAGFLRLAPGARYEATGRGIFFVLAGEGDAGGQRFSRLTTVFLDTDERTTLTASAATELLHYGLPDLADLTAFVPSREAAE
jgi:hypothetical protein